MEINNITNNPISDLNVQNNLTSSDNKLSVNNASKISDSFSNSYFVNPDISPKRSDLSNAISQDISDISSNQLELSKLNNQNNILHNIVQASTLALEKPETLTVEVEQSLNELMNKYETIISTDIATENENSNSNAYFDGMAGAKPLKLQDMINTSTELMHNNKSEIKVVEDKVQATKTKVLETIGDEISKTSNLQPNKNIDFGKSTSDFSASSINALVGSIAITQANAIPIQSQRLLV